MDPFFLSFLTVRDDSQRGGEDVKQFAVGNIDDPEEAWNDVEVPEEVGIDFDISKKLG